MIESDIFTTFWRNLKNKFNVVYYSRYVDDILLMYNSNYNLNLDILTEANNVHPKLIYPRKKKVEDFFKHREGWRKSVPRYIEINRRMTTIWFPVQA